VTVRLGLDGRMKCGWCAGDPLYEAYHDEEWGTPLHDDRALFGLLLLEGFQAGLAWITILRKRDNFARVFDQWDAGRIAAYGPDDIDRLMNDAGIVRNRMKIEAAISNAQAYLRLREEEGSFAGYLWSFVDGQPIVGRPISDADYRATSPESDAMSKALKQRGFRFVGSTICYAFMQSAGLVDDHMHGCFRAA
jgi:DNA-3-methyladenine glycosylase I